MWGRREGRRQLALDRRDAADPGRRRHRLLARRRRHGDRLHRRQRLRRRRRRSPASASSVHRRRRDVDSTRAACPTRRHHLQGRGRPDDPQRRLRRHRRGPVPLHATRPPSRQRRTCRRHGCAAAELHRRRPEGLRAGEHGHRRRRPGPGATTQTAGADAGRSSPRSAGAPATSRAAASQITPTATSRPQQGIYRSGTAPRLVHEGRHEHGDRAAGARSERLRRQSAIGRVELGAATGAEQDHSYLYAIVAGRRGFKRRPSARRRPRGRARPGPRRRPSTASTSPRLRQDVDAHGRRARQLKDPPTRLGAERHRVRGVPVLPGRPGLVQPADRAGPDARRRPTGVPTRLAFGLEEVWENKVDGPLNGADAVRRSRRPLLRRRHLPVPRHRACPTARRTGRPAAPRRRTPTSTRRSGSRRPRARLLAVGNDGGAYCRTPRAARRCRPDNWGRGANPGFNTLLPYDAQVAKDGTIYAGLQDNGELRSSPTASSSRSTAATAPSAPSTPDNSDSPTSPTRDMRSPRPRRRQARNDVAPPTDTYQFTDPFTMDPTDAAT